MPQVSMTVRMDSKLKAMFDELCAEFGMSANTAMNVFAKAVVRTRSIPFELKIGQEDVASTTLDDLIEAQGNDTERDDALMTKEELEAKIARGEHAYKMGLCGEIMANEDLTAYLKRRGYNV